MKFSTFDHFARPPNVPQMLAVGWLEAALQIQMKYKHHIATGWRFAMSCGRRKLPVGEAIFHGAAD
jgi:hypothetical protein